MNLARAGHAQRPRIAQIRDNLTDRVAAAGHDGWPGEAEGQNISLAGAGGKLARIDRRAHPAPIGPGMPVPARHAGTAAAGRVFATPSPARTV